MRIRAAASTTTFIFSLIVLVKRKCGKIEKKTIYSVKIQVYSDYNDGKQHFYINKAGT